MDENIPLLVSSKPLKPEFHDLKNIPLTCNNLTIGRGLNNSVVIKFLSISRNHCIFKKMGDHWFIEDNSTFGISINGVKLGKSKQAKLSTEDIIVLEPSEEFVYRFIDQSDVFEVPRKRIKLERTDNENLINNVKMKFEESQTYEIKHIEEKIQNAQNMKETSRVLKEQLQLDMDRKMKQLKSEFALQIENLKGEKNEVENQKTLLLAERDNQLSYIQKEMEAKISELKDQIQRHNEAESELFKENVNLKEKLLKEREEFLAELSRESSSKQDMLDNLNAKMKEQEEIRTKEKEELEKMLRNETEQLRLAKEKELKELEEQKKQRERELEEELSKIKMNLENQMQQAEQERLRAETDRLKAEQLLNEQMEEQKKLTDEEKIKMKQLIQEREDIQKKLSEAQDDAQKSIEELKARVVERETELAALAADRIQKQADQSSEVITSLQEQLEKVKTQLESVETEKKSLLESIGTADPAAECSSKQTTLEEVGQLMENELQCSICAELFVSATTLNCSHTFCKYCITMWKKKKKDCPICRSSITSECKSLVLDTFIEKMVQNLTEEMKTKRQEMLKSREELESALARQPSLGTSRGSFSFDETDYSDSDLIEEGEEEESDEEFDHFDSYWRFRRRRYYDESDSDSGSDESNSRERARDSARGGTARHADAERTANVASGSSVSNNTEGRASDNGGSRARRANIVEGVPGSYYGGYGRCYNCGALGHWAPGCPFR